MGSYFVVKSIIMLAALAGAFGLFFVKVRHLYRLMISVEGKSDFSPDRLSDRIRESIADVLGQRNVRRKTWAGWAHTLIFFGFIAVQPHSLELMIKGVFPGFEPGLVIPGIYSVYLYIADILAPLVLVGLAYALYRRTVVKPHYLTMGKDANYIILFTSVIIITFMLINGVQSIMPAGDHGFSYENVFPVSGIFISLTGLTGMDRAGLFVLHEIFYYIHIGTILGFLVYIPGSKHLHLLAAVPNVFVKPLEREKAIAKSDLEDEEAETFGLAKVSETSWMGVLNFYACTECGRCEEQCPASGTDKPLSPKKLIHDLKEELFDNSQYILAKEYDSVLPIIRENGRITEDEIWSCTTCRACEDICPVNIQHLDFMFEIRKQRVLMEAEFPPELVETFTSLENQANPWGFPADTRADWCRDMDVPLMSDNPEAELLWFVGCAGSFDDKGKEVSRAMARVLQKAGVNFAILGPEEVCNGDMARRAGNEYLAQMLIMQNVEVINQYNPAKILTGCPHCYNIIKNEYPDFGASYEVVNNTELIRQLFDEGKLSVSRENMEKLTFHDSCYLGRWNGIVQAPRDVLSRVSGGSAPVELGRSGYKGFCCGAGGSRMFMEETIGKRINNERAEEVAGSGAGTVVSACPFCLTMLTDGLTEAGSDMKIKDIAQIVDEVIE
ncbi:MAG: (Fe-S)-binding protein [Thermodesulfobacteriota bacterium]